MAAWARLEEAGVRHAAAEDALRAELDRSADGVISGHADAATIAALVDQHDASIVLKDAYRQWSRLADLVNRCRPTHPADMLAVIATGRTRLERHVMPHEEILVLLDTISNFIRGVPARHVGNDGPSDRAASST